MPFLNPDYNGYDAAGGHGGSSFGWDSRYLSNVASGAYASENMVWTTFEESTAVPVPAAGWLMISGLVTLGIARRRC